MIKCNIVARCYDKIIKRYSTEMSDSIKIRRVGAELFHVVGQTTTTKLIVAFCNFANASKNENYVLKITRVEGKILLSHIPVLDFLNIFFL